MTNAALRRKVARLEAQLAALKDFLHRDRLSEYETAMRAADQAERIEQARKILEGTDE